MVNHVRQFNAKRDFKQAVSNALLHRRGRSSHARLFFNPTHVNVPGANTQYAAKPVSASCRACASCCSEREYCATIGKNSGLCLDREDTMGMTSCSGPIKVASLMRIELTATAKEKYLDFEEACTGTIAGEHCQEVQCIEGYNGGSVKCTSELKWSVTACKPHFDSNLACEDCVSRGFGFISKSFCIESCDMIADVQCYNLDGTANVENICKRAEADRKADRLCSQRADSCEECTGRTKDDGSRCRWLEKRAGINSGFCFSRCGIMGCGTQECTFKNNARPLHQAAFSRS